MAKARKVLAMTTILQAFEETFRHRSSGRRRTLQEYGYKLRRWQRLAPTIELNNITTDAIQQFRERARSKKLSADTIESTISAVLHVLQACFDAGQLDAVPGRGRRLRVSSGVRYVPPLEDLGKLYAAADEAKWPTWCKPAEFWQPLLVAAYWTALRHFDLFWSLKDSCFSKRFVVVTAHKTEKVHVFPRHSVFDRHIAVAPRRPGDERFFPIGICRKQVLRELHRMADAAGVKRFTLHAIRRLSCCEWQEAKWGAGEVIQGSAIRGSASRYIVPQLLKQAAPMLRWPDEMLTAEERDVSAQQQARLLHAVQRLGVTERDAVLSLAEKLAT